VTVFSLFESSTSATRRRHDRILRRLLELVKPASGRSNLGCGGINPLHLSPFTAPLLQLFDSVPPSNMTSRTVKRAPAYFLQRRFAVIFVVAVILFLYLIKSTPSPEYQTHDEAVEAPVHAPVSAVRVLARETHTASIIWLHGLGESGHAWTFLSNRTDLPV
jgi:hypothetical protein